ncbi:interleukin-4 [Numida meleagris]|uniref:interleukin-4 n=1 Tax=Numida meleagris TaxID=8996 RepID=UPI000B3E2F58|nr:interleukin-4 [Numida meleagris]XP_021266217.1 interleukin-4 [Numida meleagris]XP_021266218.1 interleukin-4 [Numida meleagris]XP_021266219.1 interleukin-4 [Numida meleagris]XP_021266220.1 interleukin-4 [Numida meleagris]
MSSSLPTLLLLLLLLAGHGAAHTLHSELSLPLQESIQMCTLLAKEASCEKMNVTDIFAGNKSNNRLELLCEAATVVRDSQRCHWRLRGLFLNLCQLVNATSSHKAPCPVAAGNTTSMHKFLEDLHRFLQQLAKENLSFSS